MKCLVCGKNYEAAECPRCRFPDIQIPEVGREQALASLMPTINAYRTNFLKSVRVELASYQWKDQNGKVVLDQTNWKLFGSGEVLQQKEQWLPEQFARIPDQKTITVTVRIIAGEETREQNVTVPNLLQPELQQIGARVDSDCNLYLMLRGETQAPVSAQPVSLFA